MTPDDAWTVVSILGAVSRAPKQRRSGFDVHGVFYTRAAAENHAQAMRAGFYKLPDWHVYVARLDFDETEQ